MLTWLTANLGTVLIALLLLLIVAGVIIKLRKDKKKGVSSCGGNCAHCAMCGACRQNQSAAPGAEIRFR
jgi:hypothetical protein